MKLLSCHIENFGKLKDFDYFFEEDLNVLFAENGWGKSTFAAFLKVMFYGFDGENRRNEEGNERLRYRPWGGGVCGGSVTFTRGSGTYRMLRTFGTRRGDDTFALYDEQTGLISSDFTDRTGEELFGIDRDSFIRTVFWSQRDHETSSTTSIQAKIGDLSARTDDLPAYDAAVKRLQREMDRLRPDRASGLIRKKEELLSVLEADKNRLPALSAQLEQCRADEQDLTRQLNAVSEQKMRRAISVSRDAAPSADARQAFLKAGEDLALSRERLSRLEDEADRIRRRGQRERRDYLQVKEELARTLKQNERSDRTRRAALRAGAALSAAICVISAVLCAAGILPVPVLIPAAILLLCGGALFALSLRKTGETKAGDTERLRMEKARRRADLDALSQSLARTAQQIRQEKAVLREAEKRHSLHSAESLSADSGTAELAASLSDLNSREQKYRLRLEDNRQQAADLQKRIRECEESASRIPALMVEIAELRDRYEICGKTLSCLEEAKNRFTSRYMNPFLRSFGRYYSMLTGQSAENVRTDADFSITIMDGGLPRNPSLMSEGTSDLIGLCRRMAMIDAMYPSEKPFLVLDDPFSNLDDERVKGGLRFLRSASLEYQILYLTCHESRL